MAYKSADEIANLFFNPERESRTETTDSINVEWRVWRYWLTAKQGNWLMNTAMHGTGEYFNGRNGKAEARGTFTRDNVLYHWTANRVGANGNVMFEVTLKIADHSEEKAREKAFNAGLIDAIRTGKATPEVYGLNADEYMRGFNFDTKSPLQQAAS